MINHTLTPQKQYPRQFWLLFYGMLISTIGSSMIWPFLMIYVSEKLHLPLTTVASLMTLNSAMGLFSSFIAGPIIDRLGRKWIMVISLAINGLVYLFMSQANSLSAFALLMGLSGVFNPLYRVGADAMMADLIPQEKRIDAYSILRTGNNLGVALGPLMGGILASTSYAVAFIVAATGLLLYGLMVLFFAAETLPKRDPEQPAQYEQFAGYGRILRDGPFMSFIFTLTLTQICAAIMWVLLAVHAKTNYHLPERLYGFIPFTNALMVVFLQVLITQLTKRRPPLLVLALGSFYYAIGVGSVALGQDFWAFWASMVVMTFGELILTPTATTLAANLAPKDMRGRYMSLYGLTWSVAAGIGPVLGGILNDQIGPAAIWYGALLIGLVSTGIFLLLAQRTKAAG